MAAASRTCLRLPAIFACSSPRVPPAEVAKCAALLESRGVKMVLPVTDQPFGHRTVFFRDPDGNVLEIYAEI